jgi:hypothetical protein
MFPEITKDKLESENARQRLESCIQATWDTLDQSLFDKLSASIHNRCEVVIAANKQANRDELNNIIFYINWTNSYLIIK